MEKYVLFITQHWILAGSFLITLLAWIIYELFLSRLAPNRVSPRAAVELINHHSAIVVDLRSESNFMSGHILESINVPANSLEKKLPTLQKYAEMPLILVLEPGQVADKELKWLEERGLKPQILQGGLQAWREASLPLTKK